MIGIFSRFGLLAMLVLLAACGARDAGTITPSKEISAAIGPFLKALRNGERNEAKKYVSSGAADELDLQFARDHVLLAQGPVLKPRMMEERYRADMQEIVIVYAGQQNGKWTSATLRAARQNAKAAYKIEYWRVTNRPPSLATGAAALKEASADAKQMRLIFWGVIALLGAMVLALIIWAFRNRTRPHTQADVDAGRPVASTKRD